MGEKIRPTAYIMGNPVIKTELESAGVCNFFGMGGDDGLTVQIVEDICQVKLEDDVAAVLVGFDGHLRRLRTFATRSADLWSRIRTRTTVTVVAPHPSRARGYRNSGRCC